MRVAIVQQSLRQYRLAFYERLRDRLAEKGIELAVIYGDPQDEDSGKGDTIELPWGDRVRNRRIKLGGKELVWQPVLARLRETDLVIVEQASRLLVNYILAVQQLVGRRRVAFWGHGRNMQVHRASAPGEWLKRALSRHVHWWFAYNRLSAEIVGSLGYPRERITSVNNAIDTVSLANARGSLTRGDLTAIYQDLALDGGNVCLFIGGMYADKRLAFLLAACDRVRAEVADFELVFIGSGPDLPRLRKAAEERPWLRLVGPKFGRDKVPYFAISKLLLMPGLVGLAILDAFALELPLVTTDVPFHSPEIAYLEDGVNGVVVREASDPVAYAAAVIHLLRNEEERKVLAEGCRRARATYTVEEMADRFAYGIERALEAQPAAGSV